MDWKGGLLVVFLVVFLALYYKAERWGWVEVVREDPPKTYGGPPPFQGMVINQPPPAAIRPDSRTVQTGAVYRGQADPCASHPNTHFGVNPSTGKYSCLANY